MSSCVCKILFKSEQICGCCCKMLRGSLFWDTRYIVFLYVVLCNLFTVQLLSVFDYRFSFLATSVSLSAHRYNTYTMNTKARQTTKINTEKQKYNERKQLAVRRTTYYIKLNFVVNKMNCSAEKLAM